MLRKLRQSEWDEFPENKLHKVFPNLKEYCLFSDKQKRRDCNSPTAHWLFFHHSFSLKGEEPPVCIGCDECLTVEHILFNCSDFIQTRASHFTAQSLHILFEEMSMEKILNYLKAINILGRL